MAKKKFIDYDMRDSFEFPLFLSDKLSFDENTQIKYIDRNDIYPAMIKKTNNDVTLSISTVLEKKSGIPGYSTSDDIVIDQSNIGPLYATTWDGGIQFVFLQFSLDNLTHSNYYNTASYNGVSNFRVTEYSLSSQFLLSELVYFAEIYLDYIQDWFSVFSILPKGKPEESIVTINRLTYKDVNFDFIIKSRSIKNAKRNTIVTQFKTSIDLYFEKPQTKDFTYELIFQFRNFFHIILNKDIGIQKVILNKDKSHTSEVLLPLDERENWYFKQSYLPKFPSKSMPRFDTEYINIQEDFENILERFLNAEKLQELTTRYLTTQKLNMPIISGFLTLTSGVEKYFNGEKYSNGKFVEAFEKKLNMLFNSSWKSYPQTKPIIKIIKDNRDYYIHGNKEDKKLTETELVPYYWELVEATKQYIENQILKAEE